MVKRPVIPNVRLKRGVWYAPYTLRGHYRLYAVDEAGELIPNDWYP